MANEQRHTLCKAERLHHRKIIDQVYEEGKSIRTPALLLVYREMALPTPFPAQVMFAVSKRLYKRAHDRNRVKRLLREGYRKQKHIVYNACEASGKQVAMLLIFTGKQLPNAAYAHGKISELLRRCRDEIQIK
jgi:ribonuclease P protein component